MKILSFLKLDVSNKRGKIMDKKLGKNIIVSIGYNILTILVPFITAPYVGRILGAESVGTYTYYQSFSGYFIMIGLLGIRTYGNRSIAKVRESRFERSKRFWELYFMQLFSGSISILLFFLSMKLFKGFDNSIMILFVLYILTTVLNVDWYCDGIEDFSSIAKRTLLIKIITLFSVFIFIKKSDDFTKYCILMSSSYFLSAIFIWPSVLKTTDFICPNFKNIIKHFKDNIILFIPVISSSIYQSMDKIMIGSISTKSQLGYYEYADKIIQIPILIYTAVGAVMLSRMSYIFENDKENAKKVLENAMDFSILIGSAFCFGILAISNNLVNVYYGEEFALAAPILLILSPTILIYGFSNVVRMQYVIPNNLNHIYIISTLCGSLVNLILNFILIPIYSSLGAAIGTVSANLAVAVIFYLYVKKDIPVLYYIKKNIPIVVLGLIMGVISKMISTLHPVNGLWLLFDVFIGAFIYLILIYLFGKKNSNHFIGQIVKKISGK